jgi:hypothetical protein
MDMPANENRIYEEAQEEIQNRLPRSYWRATHIEIKLPLLFKNG